MIELNKPFRFTTYNNAFDYYQLRDHKPEGTILLECWTISPRKVDVIHLISSLTNGILKAIIKEEIEYIKVPPTKQEIDEWVKSKERPFVPNKYNYFLGVGYENRSPWSSCVLSSHNIGLKGLGTIYFGDNYDIAQEFIDFCGSKEHAMKYLKGELDICTKRDMYYIISDYYDKGDFIDSDTSDEFDNIEDALLKYDEMTSFAGFSSAVVSLILSKQEYDYSENGLRETDKITIKEKSIPGVGV